MGNSTHVPQVARGVFSRWVSMLWDMEKSEMAQQNVLFQEEDKGSYIGRMLYGT